MPQKHPKKEKWMRETNKGWADGARDDFLSQFVDDYASSMGKGASFEDEVLRKVYREYFFHFDVDDNIEPTLPLKPFDNAWVPPTDDGTLEELRAKRELREKKKKAIRAWLLYRAQKITTIRSTVRRRLLSDTYLALLNKIGKLGIRPPKARSPFQEWQKRNKAAATQIVKDLWEAEVNAGRQSIPTRGGICPKFRQQTVQAHFASLSADERTSWAERAKKTAEDKRAEWDEVYHGPPSTAPEDRAACVKNLPAFLQPVSEGIMSLTGLMTIVHVVGPMGVLGGEIGVVSVYAGKNLDAVPVSVARWDATAYEGWRNHLVNFAKTAYSEADKEAFKLSSVPQLPDDFQPTLFEDDSLDAVVETVNAEVAAAKESGELDQSDDDSSESDSEGARPSKRPLPSASASSRKRQKIVGGEKSGHTEDRPSGVNPELVKVDGRWISRYEVTRMENIRRNAAQLKALGLDTSALPKATGKKGTATAAKKKPVVTQDAERRQSTRLTGKASPSIVDSNNTVSEGPMDVDVGVERESTPSSSTLASSTASVPPLVMPTPHVMATAALSIPTAPQPTPAPLVIAQVVTPALQIPPTASAVPAPTPTPALDTPVLPVGTLSSNGTIATDSGVEAGTEVDDEARELLLEAPDWFRVPYYVFAETDWGASWKVLLELFVKLEGSVEFDVASGSLPRTGRPEILSDWIGDGRLKPKKKGSAGRKMLVLKPKDFPVFKATFRSWWDSMQPSWRKENEHGGLIQARYGRDFGDLDVWGPNGWLSVVACLYWWGDAMAKEEEEEKNDWEQYVNDAAWMMNGLKARGYNDK